MIFQRYIDSIVIRCEDIENVLFRRLRRLELSQHDFTIISNNCWGGHVYRRYGLPYLSPTVGLYFYSDDYIKFVSDLDYYTKQTLEFISWRESKHKDELLSRGQTNVPIGILGNNVEIIFLHYSSEKDAFEKWTRRSQRINFDNIILKISEMNGCTHEILRTFESLPYKKKIAFVTSNTHNTLQYGTIVNKYADDKRVLNDTTYYATHVNLKKMINSSVFNG